MSEHGRGRAGYRYAVLAGAVIVVALAGFAGYVLYPRFDLPAIHGIGVLALAAGAGVASFFSPCSFPLLVALLGRHAAINGEPGSRPRPALFGAALALGAAVFMLGVGIVMALGGQTLFAGVTFTSPAGIAIRTFVGVLLVALGIVQAGTVRFSTHGVSRLVQPLLGGLGLRHQHPLRRFTVFGFAYVLAGFG